MFSKFIFWPWFTGLIFLIGGLLITRKRVAAAPWPDKLIALGPVFFAAPLATFAAEHLVGANFLKNMVPAWMPAHLFWAYFVGLALLGASVSILLRRYVNVSAALLGVMIFLFVLFLHLPRVIANPHDRISWAVALRDSAFAGAAWALAGGHSRARPSSAVLIATGRYIVAIALLFFAVEHFLHPTSAPGVPLEKMMPPWIPIPVFWSYLTGAALLAAGIALLIKKKEQLALTLTGLLITLAVVFVYLPMLPVATLPSQMNEATNYIADTLMFAGAILVLAEALRTKAFGPESQ